MLGLSVLNLAKNGKLDAARIWLNWARESISAGGGDDPLSGAPFARLWRKEQPAATADEIRAAAASLLSDEDMAADGAAVLEDVRGRAERDDVKTAIDVALSIDYSALKDWAKLLPVAERLSKANPDSGSAFMRWTVALSPDSSVVSSCGNSIDSSVCSVLTKLS